MRTPRILAALSILALVTLSACGAEQAQTQQAPQAPTTAASAASEAKGTTSCDTPGLGGYDLLSYSVDKTGKSVGLTATFAPIDPGHDVVVTFTTAASPKHVIGELFETGSGVAQVQDGATLETEYLDGTQDFAADHITLSVPRRSIDNKLIHGSLTVELTVDGASIETCAPRSS